MRAFPALRCARLGSEVVAAVWALSSVFTLPGCGAENAADVEQAPDVPGWLTQPERALPHTLSEVGVYPDANLNAPHPEAIAYEPRHPLWSNGSEKHRYFVLPEGTGIDTTLSDDWGFPEGTLFFKTFTYPARAGGDASQGPIPLETRVLWKTDEGFEYGVYLWDEDASDAHLLDASQSPEVSVEIDEEALQHQVPATLDCRKCHESQRSSILGFDELNLNWATDGTQTQLERFAAGGILSPLPGEPAVITHENPTTQRVLEYFEGNCVHCHNGGDFINSAFDLRHPVAVQNLINQETQGEALGGIRIVPGAPEESALFIAVSRDETAEASQAMPPVGVQRVDQAVIDLLRQWIMDLEHAEDG